MYIGETESSLGERLVEHDKSLKKCDSKSALSQHQESTGHVVSQMPIIEKIKVIEKEPWKSHRKVLEAIHIKEEGLNHNTGYELPDLYLPLL